SPTRGLTEISLHDLDTGKRLPLGQAFGRDVKMLAFAADGRSLVAVTLDIGNADGDASEANTVYVWGVAAAEPRPLAALHTFDASGFLPPARRTLAVGTADGLKLFDALTGQETHKTGGSLEKLKPVAFAPDGRTLVTNGLKLWDLGGGRERLLIP